METSPTYYIDLITRHLDGEASAEEHCILIEWLKASPANQETFDTYHKVWMGLEKAEIEASTDMDEEWDLLRSRLGMKAVGNNEDGVIIPFSHQNFRRMVVINLLRVAAVFIILMASGLAGWFLFSKTETKTIVAASSAIENTLSDGTRVTLNKGASLEYSEKFRGDRRSVKLRGEAYFNVTHDKDKPFIIASGNIRVKVLGTSFYVNTGSDGKLTVILTSGKVLAYYEDNPAEQVILDPGDKAELSKEKPLITKLVNKDENYLAWKTKHFIFRDTPLTEVVESLNKVYFSDIRIMDRSLANCRISATFSDQSLESVLKVIKATLSLKVRQSGNILEITGDSCK